MTVETNSARPVILVAGHRPRGKEVTRVENGLWRYDSFDGICRIVAELPMDATIRESQWDKAALGATVIHRGSVPTERHRDWERGYVDGIREYCEIAREANIRTRVHEGPIFYLDRRAAIISDSRNARCDDDSNHAGRWWISIFRTESHVPSCRA